SEAAAHREALALAHRAAALAPQSDAAACALMRALALAGYRAEALAHYELFARRLDGDIGSRPELETTALAGRIRSRERARHHAGAAIAIATIAPVPLVGRAAALEPLARALAEASTAPRPALCVVDGDPGLGRTRLLEEIATQCRLNGWAVAVTRAVPADRQVAWSALAGLLRGGLLDADGAPGSSPAALSALLELAPAWRDRFAGAANGMRQEPALVELLASVSQELPTLLVIDDAMWADRESLGALARAMRDLGAAPCVLLASTCAAEEPPELEQLRSRIGRDLAGCTVRLGRLDAESVRRLAAELLPTYDGAQLDRIVRRVDADAGGSPFLVVELLRAVAAGMEVGRLRAPWPSPERTLDQSFPADLPDPVVAAIRVNFRRLSPEAQALLAAAAVLPDRNAEALLARAAGLDGARAAAGLDEAEA